MIKYKSPECCGKPTKLSFYDSNIDAFFFVCDRCGAIYQYDMEELEEDEN